MSDLPRKNCWTLAEYAGDRTPDRMQRLLERASWKTFDAMDTVPVDTQAAGGAVVVGTGGALGWSGRIRCCPM